MPASMVPDDEVSTSCPGNMGKAGNSEVFLNEGILFRSDNAICYIDITQQTGCTSFYEQFASLQTRKIPIFVRHFTKSVQPAYQSLNGLGAVKDHFCTRTINKITAGGPYP